MKHVVLLTSMALLAASCQVVAAGHYEDTLRKTNGAWKFSKRAIVIEFVPAGVPGA
jgi:hypothetical protein